VLLYIDGSDDGYYGSTLAYQSFTATDDWEVTFIWIDKLFVNNAGNVHIKLYKDEGGDPDAGTLKGTSDSVAVSGSDPGGEETFTFSSPAVLENGESYFVVFYPESPATNVYFYRTPTSAYAGGGVGYSTNNGSTWVTTDEGLYDSSQFKVNGYPN